MRHRVAIVTPWFGPSATGGAESLARELAGRLSKLDAVTVLTTTSSSFFSSWEVGDLSPGRTRVDAFDVLRFPTDVRKRETFDALNEQLLKTPRGLWHEFASRDIATDPFISESINSRGLEGHLREIAPHEYDAVIFLPYLYGVVVRGIESFEGRAYLLPCLHDEAYARIPRIRRAVHRVKGLLFNSEGEAELALRLYGPGVLHKSSVVGSGIDQQTSSRSERSIVDAPYALYLGRRDPTKNLDFLISTYHEYRNRSTRNGQALKLVLAGPGTRSYHDPARGVIDYGFVDDEARLGLLSGARALLQPSANESYSRVLMEAWQSGTPVVVNGECLATASAVTASGGGWLASGHDEWSSRLLHLEGLGEAERIAYADRGRAFAAERADWETVVRRIRLALGFGDAPRKTKSRRIDQVVQTLEFGDAISAEAMFLRDRFRDLGFESTIYAEAVGHRVAAEAEHLDRKLLARADAIVYHHSIRCDATESVLGIARPRAMVYHNITPAEFFLPYDPRFADLLSAGRRQLAEIVNSFDLLVADSRFNADELIELGARQDALTIPPVVDFRRFDVEPAQHVLSKPHRGGRWLFVGRVAPNKGIDRLVDAFEAFTALDPYATLVIAGRFDESDAYFRHIQKSIAVRNLTHNVALTGLIDDADLHAYYRSSDIFVTMSEHEGFCVPVVEAMMFDLPVVALAASAIPETLGDAGLLVEQSGDAFDLACLVALVLQDASLRDSVIRAQRERRQAFFPAHLAAHAELLSCALLE